MELFLVLTFLFFAGSILGWAIEVFWRKFFSKNNPEHRWINPGFLHGTYLPLFDLLLSLFDSLCKPRVINRLARLHADCAML